MKKISVTATLEDAGERLDKFLAARSGLSRGTCRRAIAAGGVWLAGQRIVRLSRPVAPGETFSLVVEARPPPEVEPTILHEDGAVIALDKPPGLPTQGTLASASENAIAWAERRVGRRLFSVHRLDAGTSGVLVIAKRQAAATRLAASFREGRVEKRYLAVASGHLPSARGTIDSPLVRGATPGRWQVARAGQGLPARTDYEVRASAGSVLLVAAHPRTGRTHQIRVHLAHAGAPIVGDRRYRGPATVALPGGGAFVAERPMLHASALTLPHPDDGRPLTLRAPPPQDFSTLLRAFGWRAD